MIRDTSKKYHIREDVVVETSDHKEDIVERHSKGKFILTIKRGFFLNNVFPRSRYNQLMASVRHELKHVEKRHEDDLLRLAHMKFGTKINSLREFQYARMMTSAQKKAFEKLTRAMESEADWLSASCGESQDALDWLLDCQKKYQEYGPNGNSLHPSYAKRMQWADTIYKLKKAMEKARAEKREQSQFPKA